MPVMKISAVVITYNEEHCIENCIKSLQNVADEIIVVDSFSVDSTLAILKKYKVNVFQRKFSGYSDQKNWGNAKAKHEWILSLDADEELSEQLAYSINEIKQNPQFDAYECNRFNNFCGSWIRHAGWYPDRKLRLWNKQKGGWNSNSVHEDIVLAEDAKIGRMKGDLLHYTYVSLGQHYQTLFKYASLQVDRKLEKGKSFSLAYAVFKFFYRFFVMYIVKLGFLDGRSGVKLCFNNSLKYLFNFAIANAKQKADNDVDYIADDESSLLKTEFEKNERSFSIVPKFGLFGRKYKLYKFFRAHNVNKIYVAGYSSIKIVALPAFLAGVGQLIFVPATKENYTGGLLDAFIFSVVCRYFIVRSDADMDELKKGVDVLNRELRSAVIKNTSDGFVLF